ncbi:GAP family protein [Streptomyces atratus]|uniref:GAP family protein n=1 Tax=Streptomyces atratus TaxID=1893 RepID=UPI0033E366F4
MGQILSYGVGVALSPFPIVGVVLMPGTPRARSNGPALLLGRVLGLALVGTIVLLVSGGAGPSEQGQPGARDRRRDDHEQQVLRVEGGQCHSARPTASP